MIRGLQPDRHDTSTCQRDSGSVERLAERAHLDARPAEPRITIHFRLIQFGAVQQVTVSSGEAAWRPRYIWCGAYFPRMSTAFRAFRR